MSTLAILATPAAHVACCPLVSPVEYAPRALLRLEKKMGQTDGWMPHLGYVNYAYR